MEKRWHQRPVGWLVGIGTAGAMAAMLAVAASSGAASPEKAYERSTSIPCVVAPGVLNVNMAATVGISFKGPETVQEAESGIEFGEASVSLQVPPETREQFTPLGVTRIRGTLESLVVDATDMQPAELNIVAPPGGSPIPYEAKFQEGGSTDVRFPSEGTFSLGPYTVTGAKGQNATLSLGTAPGFEELAEGGYRATGSGIEFTLEGLNERGEKKIGPLAVACNAPSGVTLAQIPITERTATSEPTREVSCTYTTRSPHALYVEPSHGPAAGGTTVTISGGGAGAAASLRIGYTPTPFELVGPDTLRAVTPPGHGAVQVEVNGPATSCPSEQYLGIGSYTYEPAVEKAEYKGWTLAGSITDKKLGQAIALPAGAAFNGSGEVSTESGRGSVTGSFTIPPFTAPLRLFGAIPVGIGMTLTQTAPAGGTVEPGEGGNEALALPVKLQMGVTSVSLLGLTIPTRCQGAEPLSLALSDTLSREALLKSGWSFAGATAIPPFRCEGGLLGRLFGAVLTGLLSGPEDAYSLSVSAPAG
jgi:hypothetical protein